MFPEGGSHDRPDLLELKPGVALIALGVSRPVPIVPVSCAYEAIEHVVAARPAAAGATCSPPPLHDSPPCASNSPRARASCAATLSDPPGPSECTRAYHALQVGLSYFKGHAFRAAKVTVHIGPPITASPMERLAYGVGGEQRRGACKELLRRIENAMRAVIVPAHSFEELQLIHVTRRLWLGPAREFQELDPAVRQDLDRRFAFGIQRILKSVTDPSRSVGGAGSPRGGGGGSPGSGSGKKSARLLEVEALIIRLKAYDQQLKRLGLKDSQVQGLERAPVFATLFTLGHMVTMLCVSSLPTIILNLPVGLAAMLWAKYCQRAAFAASKVKVNALDVVLSEKIKFAIVAVPSLWLTYATLLFFGTSFSLQDVLTLLMVAPVASYFGVISAESGMIALRDLRPMLARLTYNHAKVEALKGEQLFLQGRVREELHKLIESDPVVKELYQMRGEVGAKEWERLAQDKAPMRLASDDAPTGK